ncbi:MAG: APC family permease [Acidimicrobiales bacterium]
MADTTSVGTGDGQTDQKDLATFGYKQELHRTLGTFSSFAAAFSYISPSTGIFTLFAVGLATIGGVFIWSWPIVALGQFIIALNFAEVSSHYPVAGSVFQWTKYLANKSYSWFTGWIYIFAGILTVTAVVVTLPLVVLPMLDLMGWHVDAGALGDQVVVALITLVVITLLNIYSVKLVSIVNNTGVFFEIVGMVIFAVIMLIFHRHQSISVLTNSDGIHVGIPAFTAAMFMSLFVIYGFDTASTLAEETRDPRRAAPRAVLSSIAGAFVIGGIFLVAMLLAIPNLKTAVSGYWGPVNIIRANFSTGWAIVYYLVVTAAILVCCMCIMTSTIRLCFGMARDNRLPASKTLARVHPKLHTPVWSCVTIAVIAAIPLLKYAGAGIEAIAATAMIYLSYFLGNCAILYARLAKKWPTIKTGFSLGKWGPLVNILGILWGGIMLVNFAWPRPAGNPTPTQVSLSFGAHWLNQTPILYSVFIFVMIIGTIYYFAVERGRSLPVNVPSEVGEFHIPPESLPADEV